MKPMTVSLSAAPRKDLRVLSEGDGFSAWEVVGEDPQLALLAGRRLPAGAYRLVFAHLAPVPEGQALSLYVDSGAGFTEVERIDIRPVRVQAGFEVTLELPWGARALRLDPVNGSERIALGGISLELVRRFDTRFTRIARFAWNSLSNPHALGAALKAAVRSLRQDGLRGLYHAVRRSIARSEGRLPAQRSFEDWVYRFDTLTPDDVGRMRKEAERQRGPAIAVLMPVYNTPEPLLRQAIESVRGQAYPYWELCIADDASTLPHVRQILDEYAQSDDRIRVAYREANGHISAASNSALELVTSEWVALLDHDDILRPHALFEVAREIGRYPQAGLIYSDEDKINLDGKRYDAFFKPDFSMEMFRSHNYLNHLTVHRTENIRGVGGWRIGYEGSQDYDLNLRIVEKIAARDIRHIPKILYHWRAAEGSTAAAGDAKSYAYDAGLRALTDHLARTGSSASVEQTGPLPFYRVRHRIPAPEPLVSLIIPTRDRVELLRACVTSILKKTAYPSFEIIIMDNGSTEPQTVRYLRSLEGDARVRVIAHPGVFNYSAINNHGVREARGEIIGLVNNDIEVISPDWLGEMASWALQEEIGCVGAKLYYGDDTIQHGGVTVGLGGVASHTHRLFPRSSFGYFGLLHSLRNVSAVTGACLLLRKSVFDEVGGLDEQNLQVAFNDVDLCLKVKAAGYRNVWTPYAELYHLESVSRGQDDSHEKRARFMSEIDHMKRRWPDELKRDPFYSPNLTLDSEDYALAFPPRT